MNKCIICNEWISDEFQICSECKKPKAEREKLYRYSQSIDVNKIYKEFRRECFFRSIFDERGVGFFYSYSTWSQDYVNSLIDDYVVRIKKGKIKIYYLDVVAHILDELKIEAEDYKSFLGLYHKGNRIKRINKYHRFSAYYRALLRLGLSYDSPD